MITSILGRRLEIGKTKKLGLSVCHFSNDSGGGELSLHVEIPYFVSAFLRLCRVKKEPKDMSESYGFTWMNGPDWGCWASIHFNWGDKCKIIYMPWSWQWVRTSYLKTLDGLQFFPATENPMNYQSDYWYHEGKKERRGRFKSNFEIPKWSETYPYKYTTKRGDVQHAQATVTVEEREWRWKALTWLPWIRDVRRDIWVEFSEEMGDKRGSWKGGVTGCGQTMKPGETPLDCLRRMEATRRFDR